MNLIDALNIFAFHLDGKWEFGKGYSMFDDDNVYVLRNPNIGCIKFNMVTTSFVRRGMLNIKTKVTGIKVESVACPSKKADEALANKEFLKRICADMKKAIKSWERR